MCLCAHEYGSHCSMLFMLCCCCFSTAVVLLAECDTSASHYRRSYIIQTKDSLVNYAL